MCIHTYKHTYIPAVASKDDYGKTAQKRSVNFKVLQLEFVSHIYGRR